MYKYPIDSLNNFSVLLQVNSNEHTMESSLQRYMEIKIHPFIEDYNYSKIIVRGMFDRSSGISNKEKTDKQFNYMRPTASIEDSVLYINCFPGIDYVYHYGNIIKSYMLSANKKIVVLHILPNEMVCLDAIINSGLKDIPKVSTVIMGYVE